jgi:hypothetical protein
MSTVTIDRCVFPCGPVAGALVTAHAWAQTAPVPAGPADPKLIEDLVADSLPRAMFRSVYTEVNARLQAQAIALGGPVTYLDDEVAPRAEASVAGTISRPWELWEKKALAR